LTFNGKSHASSPVKCSRGAQARHKNWRTSSLSFRLTLPAVDKAIKDICVGFQDYHYLLSIRTKMRVKLAAKLLVIAWTLMKKKQPFAPSYLKAQ
jgi:hypothetical protein